MLVPFTTLRQLVNSLNRNSINLFVYLLTRYLGNDETSFVDPNSAFTIEFPKTFKASKVVLCFNMPNGGRINEIKVLGK